MSHPGVISNFRFLNFSISRETIVQLQLMFHETFVIFVILLHKIKISSFFYLASQEQFLFIFVYFLHLSSADSFRCLSLM